MRFSPAGGSKGPVPRNGGSMENPALRKASTRSIEGRIASLARRRRRLLSCIRELENVESRIGQLRDRLEGLKEPRIVAMDGQGGSRPGLRPNTQIYEVYDIIRAADRPVRIGEVWRLYNAARGQGYLSEMGMTAVVCKLARRGAVRRVGKGIYIADGPPACERPVPLSAGDAEQPREGGGCWPEARGPGFAGERLVPQGVTAGPARLRRAPGVPN